MSVDRRLRDGLNVAADSVVADDRAAYDHVVARGARRRQQIVVLQVAAAVGALVVVGLVGAVVGQWRSDRAVPPAAEQSPLVGTYVVDVAATPQSRELGMAGRWVVTLRADDLIEVAPPAGSSPFLPEWSYRVDGDEMRTDLFLDQAGCQASDVVIATYAWERDGTVVRFDPVAPDGCASRLLLLSGQPWQAAP